ncbi:Beta-glucosidase 21 [Apostasia shenzhenica]|uniref:Beta-glucosidase 21 n=1 Tax=Apostasia shenzhenica TaxID=1088818 RepID=A0A2I0AQ44_9ASPA|nr:Beta-glucosidase 21 [Apostasia shenzhenica]
MMKKLAKMAAVAMLVALLLPAEHLFSAAGLAVSEFTREDFPADFVFGAGTSAFQAELLKSSMRSGFFYREQQLDEGH